MARARAAPDVCSTAPESHGSTPAGERGRGCARQPSATSTHGRRTAPPLRFGPPCGARAAPAACVPSAAPTNRQAEARPCRRQLGSWRLGWGPTSGGSAGGGLAAGVSVVADVRQTNQIEGGRRLKGFSSCGGSEGGGGADRMGSESGTAPGAVLWATARVALQNRSANVAIASLSLELTRRSPPLPPPPRL